AGIYRLLNIGDAIGAERAARDATSYKMQLATAQATFQKLSGGNAEQQKLVQAARAKLAEYIKAADLAIELGSVDVNTGTAAMQTADQAFQELAKIFEAVVENERKTAQEIFESTRASYRNAWITMLALAI